MVDAASGRLEYLSPAFEEIWGIDRDTIIRDFERFFDFVHPADRDRVRDALPRTLAGGNQNVEYRVLRPDGEVRHILDTGFPIRDSDGSIVRVGGIAQDLTERRRQEKALEESERRFRSLVEGIPQMVWRADEEGRCTWVSPQWTDFTGLASADSFGWGWLDAVHPGDREAVRQSWRDAAKTERMQGEWRLCCTDGSEHRWFQTRATPVRDDNGEVVEWLGTSTDIGGQVEMQERLELLLAELQHRVRNLLGMVRSIVRQSAEGYDDVDDYVAHLTGRIDAMARTQVMLTRKAGAAIDLEALVREELSRVADENRIAITGPSVELSARAAEVLTLAVHELATNSIKYGALGCEGRLAIRWFVTMRDKEDWLELMWEERCPEPVEASGRRGFGTELIEGRVPYELKGEGSIRIEPEGLLAEIAFPLGSGASILEPGEGAGQGSAQGSIQGKLS